ncbi:hypothetical protein [Crateriforma conspicua]|uniref:hypothetical protein n=1 Tax=Crateriforma conspicua TaxID=2527996 RepID=UPI0011A26EF9|nr:hypothetical protein [Crateriforma conspicua]
MAAAMTALIDDDPKARGTSEHFHRDTSGQVNGVSALTAPTDWGRHGFVLVAATCWAVLSWMPCASAQNSQPSRSADAGSSSTTPPMVTPWDYDPYRVLIWLASDDPAVDADAVEKPLRKFLRRDFDALWRLDIRDTPVAVGTEAMRDLEGLDFQRLASSDLVIAVKRNHPDASQIRYIDDVNRFVDKVATTSTRRDVITRHVENGGQASLSTIADKLNVIDGDSLRLMRQWPEESTEALFLTRGAAGQLDDPEAKLVIPPLDDQVIQVTKKYDKVFIVTYESTAESGPVVRAVELDTLMRYVGGVKTFSCWSRPEVPASIGRAVTAAFAPVVRLDDAGTKTTSGLVRGGGLIVAEDSPAMIRVGDVLRPMIRKNDHNGKPLIVGPADWTYVLVTEADQRKAKGNIHAGKSNTLKVRMNNRTFRMGLKVAIDGEQTELRLHAREKPDFPLIGYEIYERELDSRHMNFVGRTNWDGRLVIERNDQPLRLFYVKNGGAVLARLPLVPGRANQETAGLIGDDMRLRAEAYVRGVQNAIIDLVAIRELFAARIRLRLERGEIDKAEELLGQLRDQPTNQAIADDLSNKQDEFLKAIGRDPNQRRKVDNLFATTRETLVKFINGRLLSELEVEVLNARKKADSAPAESEPDPKDEDPFG